MINDLMRNGLEPRFCEDVLDLIAGWQVLIDKRSNDREKSQIGKRVDCINRAVSNADESWFA